MSERNQDMQRGIAGRPVQPSLTATALLALLLFACGSFAPCGVRAQSQPSETGASLLLVIDLPEGVKTKNEVNLAIKNMVRDALNESKLYSVHVFLPGESLIKRALKDRLISPEDMVEPYKPEGLKRIARAVGSQQILTFYATQTKNEIQTKYRIYESSGPELWITKADSEGKIDAVLGKKRLSTDDIARIFTDQITASAGVVTHFSENIKILNSNKIIYDPNRGKKPSVPKEAKPPKDKPKTDPGADLKNDPANGEKAVTTGGDESSIDPAPEKKPAVKPTPVGGKGAKNQKNSKNVRTDNPETAPKNGAAKNPVTVIPESPELIEKPNPARTIDSNRPNYQELAKQFKGSGDGASVISFLRKAVNEKPMDVELRKQLSLAYFDRKMGAAALEEATRIIQLDPKNGSLHRLYGELLMKQGDTPGALIALREAIQLAPSDISIQVSYGDALLKTGKFPEAVEVYESAVKSDPKSPLPHRRLARAFAGKAETEAGQYEASLEHLKIARTLTPVKETQIYQEDYIGLMRLIEKRISGMLIELTESVRLKNTGKAETDALIRQSKDLKSRSEKLSDYLNELPPAAGFESLQAHLSQSDSLLIQAVNFYREALAQGDDRTNSAMMNAQILSQRELDVAKNRLTNMENR